MNTRPDKPNDDKQREELRQQLWELSYGLLDTDADAALCARIKSDPAIARLYAEVKLQADLVSVAARVEDSSLMISAGGAGVGSVGVSKGEKRSGSKSGSTTSSRAVPAERANGSWGTNWLAVAGTTALLLLLGYGLWQPDVLIDPVAKGEYYYTRVTGLVAMTEGITQKVGVEYKDIDDNGRSAELDVRLVDQEGQETYRTQVRTAGDGRAEVDLPGTVLKKGVRLEVSPAAARLERNRDGDVVSAELQVADEKRKTVLLTERPYAKPGQSNKFQLFGVGEFSKTITPPATDELMVENQSGADVVQPMWTVDPANGVISGQFELPQTYSATDGLAMRRRETEKRRLEMDRAGGTLRQAGGAARETYELQRGTNGVAKAELAKSSAAARDASGKGGAFGGSEAGMARSSEAAGAAPSAPPGAPAPNFHPPMPRPENAAPAAPLVNRKNADAVAAADKPVADKPTADKSPSKPGEAAALNSPMQETGAQPTGGQPDFRQQNVRTSARELQFEVTGLKDVYAPGEKVQLSVRVLDERGRPAAAAAGVRVWSDVAARSAPTPLLLVDSLSQADDLQDDEVVRKAAEEPLALAASIPGLQEKEADKAGLSPGRGLRANQALGGSAAPGVSETPASAAPFSEGVVDKSQAPRDLQRQMKESETVQTEPSATLGLSPGTATTEVFFADNRALVQQEYERARTLDEMHRAERVQAFGRILLWAGAGLMLLVGLLLVARQPLKSTVLIPALGIAVLSLGLGIAWFLPRQQEAIQLAKTEPGEVAPAPAEIFVPAQATPPAVESFRKEGSLEERRDVNSIPAPALPVDPGEPPSVAIAPSGPLNVPAAAPGEQQLKQLAQLPNDAGRVPNVQGTLPENRPAAGFNGGLGQGGGGLAAPGAKPGTNAARPAAAAAVDRQAGNDEKAKNGEEEQKGTKSKPATNNPAEAKSPAADAVSDEPAAKKSDGNRAKRERLTGGYVGEQPLPDSLFWRPLSPVDSDGTFTIEFTMPAAESDYRLLLDAIGSGRIGGKQEILRCRE